MNLKKLSKLEAIDKTKLAARIRDGRIVVFSNPIHSPTLCAVGEGLRVKINANIGTSPVCNDIETELAKARVALKFGADTLMDLSTGDAIDDVRRKIIKNVRVPVGTVPIYQCATEFVRRNALADMTEDDIFNAIERHARDGVDFMTLHCGVTKESVAYLKKGRRVTDIVSRGGTFMLSWMLHTNNENPLYKNYDYLLELGKKFQFTISLGDGLRPGALADATDAAQISELIILSRLVKRAREKGVGVIVEGPGHVPLNQIETNVRLEKTVCDGAPFYVLGPLVTDIAPGYDHITGAIGGALAAYYGADFLCYVTPAEHLSFPTIEDVIEGTIASKIAAHAADVARGRDWTWDLQMSKCRKALDWRGMFRLAINPEKATKLHERFRCSTMDDNVCSMCGDFCALKIATKILRKK